MFIDVVVRAPLKEENRGLDLSKEDVREGMEKAASEEIKSIIIESMNRMQKEFGIDPYGIGELVHARYPQLWKNIKDKWEDRFTDLDFTVNVKVRFPDTGFTNAPPNIRRGR